MKSDKHDDLLDDKTFYSNIVYKHPKEFKTHKKPKHSHFPSVSNSKKFSNTNLSLENNSLLNILNISKFDLNKPNMSTYIENPKRQNKKSVFQSLKNTSQVKIHVNEVPNKVTSEAMITQFDDGNDTISNKFKQAKSIFGLKDDDPNQLNLNLNQVTSINKEEEKGFNDFMNTVELHSSRPDTNATPPMSTFENIELISNIFSQMESQEEESSQMNVFSFENSDEIFKESEEQELNEIPILGSSPKEHVNQNVFKGGDRRGSKENEIKPKQKVKEKKNYKISTKKKINLKDKKLSNKIKRTPLKIIQNKKNNQGSSKRKNSKILRQSKKIKTSQNQKMSEIFMNVIKI
jgi:hypothetical protein